MVSCFCFLFFLPGIAQCSGKVVLRDIPSTSGLTQAVNVILD